MELKTVGKLGLVKRKQFLQKRDISRSHEVSTQFNREGFYLLFSIIDFAESQYCQDTTRQRERGCEEGKPTNRAETLVTFSRDKWKEDGWTGKWSEIEKETKVADGFVSTAPWHARVFPNCSSVNTVDFVVLDLVLVVVIGQLIRSRSVSCRDQRLKRGSLSKIYPCRFSLYMFNIGRRCCTRHRQSAREKKGNKPSPSSSSMIIVFVSMRDRQAPHKPSSLAFSLSLSLCFLVRVLLFSSDSTHADVFSTKQRAGVNFFLSCRRPELSFSVSFPVCRC